MRGGKMENTVIFAVSQERYFYLWPGFSIKYWRWTSKDSFWWHGTEWWLCWSWKWHSAVWWGVSSEVCKVQVCFLHPAFCTKNQSWFWLQKNIDKTTGHILYRATDYDSFSHSLPFETLFPLTDFFSILVHSTRLLAQLPPSIPHGSCSHDQYMLYINFTINKTDRLYLFVKAYCCMY